MPVNDTARTADAAREADALLEASAALRRELVAYERELRRTRKRVLRQQWTEAPNRPELIALRRGLTGRFDEFEECRRRWRVAYFSLETEQGMSHESIARKWEISRQLVSRIMRNGSQQEPGTRADKQTATS